MPASNLYDVTSRLKKYGVEFLTSTKLIGIEDENIKVESTINGEVSTIKADNVILSLGVEIKKRTIRRIRRTFLNCKSCWRHI